MSVSLSVYDTARKSETSKPILERHISYIFHMLNNHTKYPLIPQATSQMLARQLGISREDLYYQNHLHFATPDHQESNLSASRAISSAPNLKEASHCINAHCALVSSRTFSYAFMSAFSHAFHARSRRLVAGAPWDLQHV